jgi:1-phosphofructokinase family hexose kinase
MLVAGPNLALQRVADLDLLRPGEVLRFNHAAVSAGGKGVNVCRAARTLGARARLITFTPGLTGRATVELAVRDGIEVHQVACGGEARVATIVREASGRVTVLNEPGPEITATEWAEFVRTVESHLEGGEVLVCSGTLPPGGPGSGYAELVELAHARGGLAVVDAHGELLQQALEAKPDVVKPNLLEAEATLGTTDSQRVAAAQIARERSLVAAEGLVAEGALAAAVTAGDQGAALAGHGPPLWVPAPRVEVVNPIGAGDCFAAVLAAGLEAGRPLHQVFDYAVAVSAASVEHPVPGDFDPRRAAELS